MSPCLIPISMKICSESKPFKLTWAFTLQWSRMKMLMKSNGQPNLSKMVYNGVLLTVTKASDKSAKSEKEQHGVLLLYFDLLTRPKMPFQGDAPEGGDTF